MQYIEISSNFSAAHFLESEFIHGHNFKIKAKFENVKEIDLDKAKKHLMKFAINLAYHITIFIDETQIYKN